MGRGPLAYLLLCLAVGSLWGVPAAAQTHYVSLSGNCGIASPCYDNIQAAVDAASSGEEIRVAANTYYGVSMVEISSITYYQVVMITKSLTLRGGYLITDWENPDPNVLIDDGAVHGFVANEVAGEITVTHTNTLSADPATILEETEAGSPVFSGTGAFSGDPMLDSKGFINSHDSAAIDSGVDSSVPDDIESEYRPFAEGYDIGADEFHGIIYQADLAITKDDGQTAAVPGEALTYTITVDNSVGPDDVSGATVTDFFTGDLIDVSWTCAAIGGASCGAGSGSDDINEPVDLPVGGQVTFTVDATIHPGAVSPLNNTATVTAPDGTGDPQATGTLENTATVTAPIGVSDSNTGNDSATDTDTIELPEIFDDGFESGNTSAWSISTS